MKRRARKVVNFFAFNLLFFALYLNFIHKDKAVTVSHSTEPSVTVLNRTTTSVANPESYLNKVAPVSEETKRQ